MNRLPTHRPNGSALTLLLSAIILLVILAWVLPKLLGSSTATTDGRVGTAEQHALQQAASAANTLSQDHTASALAAAEGDQRATTHTPDRNVQMSGEGIVRSRCLSCHAANSVLPHTPRLGNTADWAPLLRKGKQTLVDNAYNGYVNPEGGVMPPKGGDASLSRAEVEAAVVYLANQSGGQW